MDNQDRRRPRDGGRRRFSPEQIWLDPASIRARVPFPSSTGNRRYDNWGNAIHRSCSASRLHSVGTTRRRAYRFPKRPRPCNITCRCRRSDRVLPLHLGEQRRRRQKRYNPVRHALSQTGMRTVGGTHHISGSLAPSSITKCHGRPECASKTARRREPAGPPLGPCTDYPRNLPSDRHATADQEAVSRSRPDDRKSRNG